MDLFQTPELLPDPVLELIYQADLLSEQQCAYTVSQRLLVQLEVLGYEFDIDLDGVGYDLRPQLELDNLHKPAIL